MKPFEAATNFVRDPLNRTHSERQLCGEAPVDVEGDVDVDQRWSPRVGSGGKQKYQDLPTPSEDVSDEKSFRRNLCDPCSWCRLVWGGLRRGDVGSDTGLVRCGAKRAPAIPEYGLVWYGARRVGHNPATHRPYHGLVLSGGERVGHNAMSDGILHSAAFRVPHASIVRNASCLHGPVHQYSERITGTIEMRGRLQDRTSVLCDAFRLALLQIASDAVGQFCVVAVEGRGSSVSSGPAGVDVSRALSREVVVVDTSAVDEHGVEFKFDVAIATTEQRNSIMELLQKEAKYRGALTMLPALVAILDDALVRLSLRLWLDLQPRSR